MVGRGTIGRLIRTPYIPAVADCFGMAELRLLAIRAWLRDMAGRSWQLGHAQLHRFGERPHDRGHVVQQVLHRLRDGLAGRDAGGGDRIVLSG